MRQGVSLSSPRYLSPLTKSREIFRHAAEGAGSVTCPQSRGMPRYPYVVLTFVSGLPSQATPSFYRPDSLTACQLALVEIGRPRVPAHLHILVFGEISRAELSDSSPFLCNVALCPSPTSNRGSGGGFRTTGPGPDNSFDLNRSYQSF